MKQLFRVSLLFFGGVLSTLFTVSTQGQGLPAIDNFDVAPVDAGWIRHHPAIFLHWTNQATVYTIENGAYRIRVPYGTKSPLQDFVAPGTVPGQQPPPSTDVGEVDGPVEDLFRDPTSVGYLGDSLEDVYLARAGAFRPMLYADFFQAVDVVKWDDATRGNFWGVLSRIGSPVFLTTTGYVGIYLKDQQVMIFGRMGSEIPVILTMTQVKLDPAQKYRLVHTGTGTNFTFSIYKANDLLEPIATTKTSDSMGILYGISLADTLVIHAVTEAVFDGAGQANPLPNRLDGEPVQYPGVGPAGLIVFNMDDRGADATFDNYLSAGNPNLNMIGFPGTPQVLNLNPAPNKSFHPISEKISFVVRTYWTNEIPDAEIKLFLNGQDVSANLTKARNTALPHPAAPEILALGLELMGYPVTTAISGQIPPQAAALDDGTVVNYTGELKPNTVYDARIVLKTGDGIITDNSWTFDTFVANQTITIEAEEYNYNSGSFINASTPSGQGGYANAYIGNSSPTNTPTTGYYGRQGRNGVDFQDRGNMLERNRTFLGAGLDGLFEYYRDYDRFSDAAQSRMFRSGDAVGTTLENPDTLRASRVAANVNEYSVFMMQNGEWMNYTRQFPQTPGFYNVYLRAASMNARSVRLEQVTGDPRTEDQQSFFEGRFNIPATGSQSRYRMVPLVDESGVRAVVELKGDRTFRLVGENVDSAVQLNYFIFVPAEVPTIPASFKVTQAPFEGFTVQIHKARNSAPPTLFPNTEDRAERQLSGQLLDDGGVPFVNEAAGANNGIYTGISLINFEENGNPAGTLTGDTRFPGIGTVNPDFIAMSAVVYLPLTPGLHHWGVNSDDGYVVSTGTAANLKEMVLGRFDGGRPAARTDFYFNVAEAGIYPFRLLFYEGQGGSSVEWYTVHPLTKVVKLLNSVPTTIPADFSKATGTGSEPGFKVRVAKARQDARAQDFPNSSDRAERHLAGQIIDPNRFDENNKPLPYENTAGEFIELGTINYQQEAISVGYFPNDVGFPGVDTFGDPNWISMEVKAYLDLPAGNYRMGVMSDDGFVVSTGPTLNSMPLVLGAFEGGRGTAPTEFDFIISKAGVYPFRLIWYEGGGGADVEWYMVDEKTKKRFLINDFNSPVQAFTFRAGDPIGPEIRLLNPTRSGLKFEFSFETGPGIIYLIESTTALGGSWILEETVEGTGDPYQASLDMNAPMKFYRVVISP